MDCKACRREIDLLAAGDDACTEEARAHLASCADCRAFLKERERLRELVASVEAVQAPLDFNWKLRARLAAEKSAAPGYRVRHGFAPGVPAIAIAAIFALLIATAIRFKQSGTVSLSPTPAVATANAPSPRAVPVRDGDSVAPSTRMKSPRAAGGYVMTAAARSAAGGSRQQRVAPARVVQTRGSGTSAQTQAMTAKASVGAGLRSNDFSSGVAPVITLFPFPVRTPTQPVKVLLDEGSGTLRTVALQSVTFGSQEILRRTGNSGGAGDATLRPAQSAEDIW